MATLNWRMIAAARSLWEPGVTLTEARAQNPEYVRAQVETIANSITFAEGDDSIGEALEEIGQAIFCRYAVVTADITGPFTVHVFDDEGEAQEWAALHPTHTCEVVPAIDRDRL